LQVIGTPELQVCWEVVPWPGICGTKWCCILNKPNVIQFVIWWHKYWIYSDV